MKKLVSGFLTLVLTLTFLVLSFGAPAQAGESKNIQICHYNGSANNTNKPDYTPLAPSKSSIVDQNDNVNAENKHDSHNLDIIPSFEYSLTPDSPILTYPGKNWDAQGQAFYANGCKELPGPVNVTSLVPALPGTVQAKCEAPKATFAQVQAAVPVQVDGVTATVSQNSAGQWVVTYTKPADFVKDDATQYAAGTEVKFSWVPADFNPIQLVTILPPNSGDPLWNAETGACELSNTGLFGLSDEATYLGGGLLALGLLFVIGNAVLRRTA